MNKSIDNIIQRETLRLKIKSIILNHITKIKLLYTLKYNKNIKKKFVLINS